MIRPVRGLSSVLLIAALVGCGGEGEAPTGADARPPSGTSPAPTSTSDPGASTTTAVITPPSTTAGAAPAGSPGQPQGFERVAVEVTTAAGEVCALCLWLADTPERRGRGLMGVTDLGPADGMVFRYATPSSSSFYMLDTPLALSIAFFAADGSFVSSADMAPCVDGPPAACVRYPATAAYTDAIEVPAGELDDVGIEPGARLVVLDEPCPSR